MKKNVHISSLSAIGIGSKFKCYLKVSAVLKPLIVLSEKYSVGKVVCGKTYRRDGFGFGKLDSGIDSVGSNINCGHGLEELACRETGFGDLFGNRINS